MKNKHLIVSLHDAHPKSISVISDQIKFCENLGVKHFSILAIPHYHHEKKLKEDKEVLDFLSKRSEAGDDIVLHGFYHDRRDRDGGNFFFTKLYTANEAEFLDLNNQEVKTRLEQGMEIWKEHGWNLDGFIAPAWLMPLEQDVILRDLNFSYTTRLKAIYALQKEEVIQTQSLCYSTRAWWRKKASLLWNSRLFSKLKETSVMRLSLHPGDFAYLEVREHIQKLLELALAEDFQPVSYAEYVAM